MAYRKPTHGRNNTTMITGISTRQSTRVSSAPHFAAPRDEEDNSLVLDLLQNVELYSRPISFKTLDEIRTTKPEMRPVCQEYLDWLQGLAEHWKLIKREKYVHRTRNYDAHDHAIN